MIGANIRLETILVHIFRQKIQEKRHYDKSDSLLTFSFTPLSRRHSPVKLLQIR